MNRLYEGISVTELNDLNDAFSDIFQIKIKAAIRTSLAQQMKTQIGSTINVAPYSSSLIKMHI